MPDMAVLAASPGVPGQLQGPQGRRRPAAGVRLDGVLLAGVGAHHAIHAAGVVDERLPVGAGGDEPDGADLDAVGTAGAARGVALRWACAKTGRSAQDRPRRSMSCRAHCPSPRRCPHTRLPICSGSQPRACTDTLSRATGSVEAPRRPTRHRSAFESGHTVVMSDSDRVGRDSRHRSATAAFRAS